jgi:hypothetical protein
MIREQVDALGRLSLSPSNLVIVSGGPSPAYKKFGPEFIGAAAVEIFKGTFAFDLKKPESHRVINRMGRRFPDLRRQYIFPEDISTNTYENLAQSFIMAKGRDPSAGIVLLATIEQIPRSIETLKTIVKTDRNVKGMPINPWVVDNWHQSLWWRSRFHAEISRLEKYSNSENGDVKNPIDLLPATRAKLSKILEVSRS